MTSHPAPFLPVRVLTLVLGLAMTMSTLAQPPAPPDAGAPQTLNLRNADINVLIATVAEITGRNFIVDPRVEGKVTVITSEPMTPAEVYDTFLSVLRINGFAAVPSGRLVRIVPDAVARQLDIPAEVPGATAPDALVTRVIAVSNVSARELSELLRPLLPQAAQVAVHEGSNAIVVVDRAGNVDRIERLVRRIDTSGGEDVEVIPLRHANAAELARTLGGVGGEAGPRLVADVRSNSLLLTGDSRGRLRLRTLIAHLDTPLESGETTQVIYLRYAAARDLVPVMEALARSLEGAPGGEGEGVRTATAIQAHEPTNALVISAPGAIMESLRGVIRQLDIRRAQVLIEAVIAEVAEERAREFGIQWQTFAEDNGQVGRGIFGGTNFTGPGGGNIIGALSNPTGLPGGLNLGWVDGFITIPGPGGDPIEILNIGALLRALNSQTGTNILSTPTIVTLDNQEALIEVGQEVPFIQGEFTTPVTSGGGSNNALVNPFRTIERKSIGLKLKVTPQINEGDAVVLALEQEVSSLAPPLAGAADLITNQRILRTSVLVGDGQMLVLGGLVTEDQNERENKVPGLGNIPVLGNLFKYRSSARIRRNLMIFLRPVILRDAATESAVSGAKYNQVRGEQERMIDQGRGLLRPDEKPLLPELEALPAPGVAEPLPTAPPPPERRSRRGRR
ncbi:MAG: type II secretion system secretin GspD [Xanthomonadales bacterium]|nr:type II secretion system secretin GspD [Xanthomonadales bacterium]